MESTAVISTLISGFNSWCFRMFATLQAQHTAFSTAQCSVVMKYHECSTANRGTANLKAYQQLLGSNDRRAHAWGTHNHTTACSSPATGATACLCFACMAVAAVPLATAAACTAVRCCCNCTAGWPATAAVALLRCTAVPCCALLLHHCCLLLLPHLTPRPHLSVSAQ